jgi:opacity protein-like surface antigen
MHRHRLAFVTRTFVLGVALLTARSALAQPAAAGPIVSGSVAAAIVNDSTNVSFAGSAGYRFNRAFGLGAELTSIPGIEDRNRDVVPLIYPPFPRFRSDTDLLMFTTNVRIEVPTTSARIIPFVIAGGGLASTTSKVRFDGPIYYTLPPGVDIPPEVSAALPTIFPREDYGITQTHLALTIGGGVSIAAGHHLSIDADLREIHLSGESGGDIGRFGAGASYRF